MLLMKGLRKSNRQTERITLPFTLATPSVVPGPPAATLPGHTLEMDM